MRTLCISSLSPGLADGFLFTNSNCTAQVHRSSARRACGNHRAQVSRISVAFPFGNLKCVLTNLQCSCEGFGERCTNLPPNACRRFNRNNQNTLEPGVRASISHHSVVGLHLNKLRLGRFTHATTKKLHMCTRTINEFRIKQQRIGGSRQLRAHRVFGMCM